MTPLETLTELRRSYPTPMSKDQLGALMNAVAWAHRVDGYGLLSKPTGNNCRQPQTGKLISTDLLVLPDGQIFDTLIDSGGKAIPTWGTGKRPVSPALWLPPVDDTVVIPRPDPPVVVKPAPVYPDEPTWWKAFEDEQAALYAQAGNTLDWAAFRWCARTGFDIGAGMDREAAKAKHLAELRAALGL